MASGLSFDDAVLLARSQGRLGVGCHVVLVDGVPVLPPSEIPSLLGPGGGGAGPRFRPTLASFVFDLARRRIRRMELDAEIRAQIERIQSSGLRVTHLDSHKHTHLLPMVAGSLARAANACGIRAVRNPFEPSWSIHATMQAGKMRRWLVGALGSFRSAFFRTVREHGLMTTDGLIGIAATGVLDATVLRALLDAAPDGTWELMCHPGYQDEALGKIRTRLRREREIEHDALLDAIPQAIAHGFSLIHYGQLSA